MSHATYSFLLSIEEENDQDLIDAARSEMESYGENGHLDDNNWYSEMALLMSDGRVFQMCEKDDYRGRDSCYEWLMGKPREQRWEFMRRWVLGCVVNDMGLAGPRFGFGEPDPHPTDDMTFDELLAYVRELAPKKISEGFATVRPPADPNGYTAEWYDLKRMTRVYLAFTDCEEVPYGESDLTPYDYRAFDLTRGGEPNALLFVDIHT